MILATWNCKRGPIEDKLAALEPLKADVIVVPELPTLPPEYNGFWVGPDPSMGVAIIARPTTTLAKVEVADLTSSVILAEVTGSKSFLLLAVWARKENGYVEGLHHLLDLCEKRIASGPTVILGDLVSNTQFDGERKRKDRGVSHTDLVRRLDDLGLVSAYHSYFVEEHGQETRPDLLSSKK